MHIHKTEKKMITTHRALQYQCYLQVLARSLRSIYITEVILSIQISAKTQSATEWEFVINNAIALEILSIANMTKNMRDFGLKFNTLIQQKKTELVGIYLCVYSKM